MFPSTHSVLASSPLPLPTDSEVVDREITFLFKPRS